MAQISQIPSLFGANPAKVIDGPRKGFRALALEEDYGRELITSLPDEKRNKATIEVMKVLEPILAAYAEQNQIAFIIEQKSIVVGKNDFDVTKDIIEELDKKLPSIKIN